jgi:hypothetical protein
MSRGEREKDKEGVGGCWGGKGRERGERNIKGIDVRIKEGSKKSRTGVPSSLQRWNRKERKECRKGRKEKRIE